MSMANDPQDGHQSSNQDDQAGTRKVGMYDRPAPGFKISPLLIVAVLVILALVLYLLFFR